MSHRDNLPIRQRPSLTILCRWSLWHFLARRRNRWFLACFALLAALSQILGTLQTLKTQAEVMDVRLSETERQEVYHSAFSEREAIFGEDDSPKERENKTRRMIAKLPTSLAYSGGIDSATYLPRDLAIMSVGYSDIWPSRYRITAHSRRQNLEREDIASPFRRLFSPWDSAAFVLFALPLAVIGLTHDLISKEREGGTLPLLLLNPIPIRVYFLLAFVLRGLCLAFIVLGVHLAAAVLFNSVSVGPLVMWSFQIALYTTFWIAAAWAVNSLNRSSVMNAIALMLLWGLLTVILPSGLAIASLRQFPVRDSASLITQERHLGEVAEHNSKELLDAYYQHNPEVPRPTRKEDPYGQTRWDVIRLEVDKQLEPLLAERLSQMLRRTHFVEGFGIINPALASKFAMDELAGTSLYHYVTFARDASQYDEEYKQYFQPLMMGRGKLSVEQFESIPAFNQRSDTMPLRTEWLLKCGLATLGWSAVCFVLGWIQLRKL